MAGRNYRRDGEIEIGVAPDDRRRFAAKLESDPGQVLRSDRHDRFAGVAVPGERDHVGREVLDQSPPRLPRTGNEIEDTGWNVEVLRDQAEEGNRAER